MDLEAVYTRQGTFRVHKAGCRDVARDQQGNPGSYTERVSAPSRQRAVLALWADVLSGYGDLPAHEEREAGE
jgi:hypothetical protein